MRRLLLAGAGLFLIGGFAFAQGVPPVGPVRCVTCPGGTSPGTSTGGTTDTAANIAKAVKDALAESLAATQSETAGAFQRIKQLGFAGLSSADAASYTRILKNAGFRGASTRLCGCGSTVPTYDSVVYLIKRWGVARMKDVPFESDASMCARVCPMPTATSNSSGANPSGSSISSRGIYEPHFEELTLSPTQRRYLGLDQLRSELKDVTVPPPSAASPSGLPSGRTIDRSSTPTAPAPPAPTGGEQFANSFQRLSGIATLTDDIFRATQLLQTATNLGGDQVPVVNNRDAAASSAASDDGRIVVDLSGVSPSTLSLAPADAAVVTPFERGTQGSPPVDLRDARTTVVDPAVVGGRGTVRPGPGVDSPGLRAPGSSQPPPGGGVGSPGLTAGTTNYPNTPAGTSISNTRSGPDISAPSSARDSLVGSASSLGFEAAADAVTPLLAPYRTARDILMASVRENGAETAAYIDETKKACEQNPDPFCAIGEMAHKKATISLSAPARYVSARNAEHYVYAQLMCEQPPPRELSALDPVRIPLWFVLTPLYSVGKDVNIFWGHLFPEKTQVEIERLWQRWGGNATVSRFVSGRTYLNSPGTLQESYWAWKGLFDCVRR